MTVAPDGRALIDLVYGALYGESSWHDFLEETRQLIPAGQAVLFFHDAAAGAGAFPLNAGGEGDMVAAYNAYYSKINPWMPHAAMRPLGRVVQSDEMLPREDLKRTEFYNGYLKQQDIETGFGVTIRRDGACNFLFSVVGADIDESDARVVEETLQAVVPHLSHAFDYYRRHRDGFRFGPEWGGRAALAKARGVVSVGPDRRILFADEEACRLAEDSGCLSLCTFGRLACDSTDLLDYVTVALSTWNGGIALPAARTFHLPRQAGALPLRVTVFRPVGTGAAFFRGPECILLVEDPADSIDTAAEEFGALHRLSQAERRIVAWLAHGLTLEQIADHAGISINTVRTQSKHIFARTGLQRQIDLVRHVCVMAGAPYPHG